MRKRFTISLFAGLCFALLAPMSAFADVVINEENFPDANFRAYLLTQDYGEDGVITDDEIAEVTSINVNKSYDTPTEEKISTLEGIQYFTELTYLFCNNNQLTSLDVSGCTALTMLLCDGNQLTSLDVSNHAILQQLSCYKNQLTSLDVSKNTELWRLDCSDNQLTDLDMSGCTTLTYLYCSGNRLTSLDVSNNTALEELSCENNRLTSLDVSNHTILRQLSCNSNQLTNLNVSGCTALTSLLCNNNQLTSLNTSDCTALTSLLCSDNQLASLDLSKNTVLTFIRCSSNKIYGENMDKLIESLSSYGISIMIYDRTSETEGNVCTRSQVAAIKAKWCTPYYLVGYDMETNQEVWREYEGSDDLDGIIATEMGNGLEFGANAVAYDLNGRRVEGWQNRKGVYIINGKKVMVK